MARQIQSTQAAAAGMLLGFGRRFGPWSALGCVLRTASASIWRSSAFVFGGSRVKLDCCQLAMDSMWGCWTEK